jgi:hypothetical protein
MDTQHAPESHGRRLAEKSFLKSLCGDAAFRRDARRTGFIAITALIVDAAMLGLIGSGLDVDANTLQVFVFASFVATLVVVSALAWYVVRVTDEYFWFRIDRMTQ